MAEQTELRLKIEGMHCDACVRRVKGALEKLPGVSVQGVTVGEAEMVIDPRQVSAAAIVAAVSGIGFEAEARS